MAVEELTEEQLRSIVRRVKQLSDGWRETGRYSPRHSARGQLAACGRILASTLKDRGCDG